MSGDGQGTSSKEDETYYPVEALLGYRVFRRYGRREVSYKVKWRGYEETTWERIERLTQNCGHLIYDFHKENPHYGPSPIKRRQVRAGWDNEKDMEPSLWPTYGEVLDYLRKNIPQDCHLIENDEPVEYKDGINAGIVFANSHAYLAIVLVNFNGIKSLTLIGDSMNSFIDEERREENKEIGNKLLKILEATEAEVLIVPTQTKEDVCAYMAIQALLTAIQLIKEIGRIPALISFPSTKVQSLMKEFGKEYKTSKSVERSKFGTAIDFQWTRCSFCLDFKTQKKNSYKLKRMHEGKRHRGDDGKTYNYRMRPILRKV